jgi:DNA-binding XRE family transcriptional regulator
VARLSDIDLEKARAVIDEVRQAVGSWRELAEGVGISARTITAIEQKLPA